MRKLLIFSCIMGLALMACSNTSPVANEGSDELVFAYPGSSPDPMTESVAVATTHLTAVKATDLPNVPAAQESYQCLWTSGTYNETGTWNWSDTDFDYTVGNDGSLEFETINALCSPVPGILTTAAAFYYPPNEKKALNYDLFGSVYWGYLPGLNPGWCWILMVDWNNSGIPHSHGITVNLDWAGAYNHGASIPPIGGICGWPLVGNPPPTFRVHGI
jgi:hypothetical protein